MKSTFQPAILLLVLLMVSCSTERIALKPTYRYSGEAAEENLSARLQWELGRLADPKTGRIPPGIREKELAFAATIPGGSGTNRLAQQVAWQQRGPYNLGGRTRALAMDATNENVLFAGGISGGLWRSTDGGDTWNRVTSLTGYQGVLAIAQDTRPGHTDTWYYLTGEAYGTSASATGAFYLGNGVYKSTDGGLTWASLPSTVSGTPASFDNVWDVAWNIATDPANLTQDVLYAATYGAIWRSTNGGATWTVAKGATGTGAYFTDVAVSPSGVVYATLSSDAAAIHKGVWRSADGINWTNITPPNYPTVYDRMVIEIDPNDENRVYFFGPTPGFGKFTTSWQGDSLYNSLWKYEYDTTGGQWSDLSQNMPGNIDAFNGLNTQGGYDLVVEVKPGDPNTVFIGGTCIYRSTSAFNDSLSNSYIGGYDFGAQLPRVDEYPGHHPDQHKLLFLPSNPDVMLSAHDGGVSRTENNMADTVAWVEKNNGYITSQFYTVTVDMNPGGNPAVLMGGLQDNGTYYTNSAAVTDPWVHSFDGDGSYSAIANNGADYYFSKQQGRVYKTAVDASGNVTAYRRIDPIGAVNYRFIAPFVIDPNNNNIMYLAAGESIWRNDDLSVIPLTNQFDTINTNWVQFPDTLNGIDEVISAVSISTVPAHRLYYGTNRRGMYRVDNANTGLPTRVSIGTTGFPSTGNASCIAVNPQNADELLVVFSNYNVYSLFHSLDAGVTWTKVGGNLEANTQGTGNGPSLRWAGILPLSSGAKLYFVGGSTGLYATAQLNGTSTTWIQQGVSTIGTSIVDMLAIRPADGLVAVGTHGNGMFSATITDPADITGLAEYKPSVSLEVYPNPARRTLNVQFLEGFDSAPAVLTILDECGRKVGEPLTVMYSPETPIQISVEDLADGLYFLQVVQGVNRSTVSFVKR
ncbi:MAG: T9SS type A sorting domain-containing protein [Bacteroidota bacterium]